MHWGQLNRGREGKHAPQSKTERSRPASRDWQQFMSHRVLQQPHFSCRAARLRKDIELLFRATWKQYPPRKEKQEKQEEKKKAQAGMLIKHNDEGWMRVASNN